MELTALLQVLSLKNLLVGADDLRAMVRSTTSFTGVAEPIATEGEVKFKTKAVQESGSSSTIEDPCAN